jgi:ABC-type glycerol-3-phosphate transport system substrate-binding protein
VCALTAAGLLAGCGAPGPASTSEGATTGTLTWYVNRTNTLTPAIYQKVADGFTKQHPGVKIQIINEGGQGVAQYFQTLMSTGNAPDVGTGIPITSQNASDFDSLSNQSWAQAEAKQSQLVRDYEINGNIYTIPTGYQVQNLIFYNKNLFRRAGITTTPTTIAELDSAMSKLKTIGVTPMADSGNFIAGAQVEALAYASYYETSVDWAEAADSGKATFSDSVWEQVLAQYKTWIEDGYVSKDTTGLLYNTVGTDFLNGQYGMYLVASWFDADIQQTPPSFPIGVFAVPTFNGETPPPQALVGAFEWEIPASTSHKALAEEFVHYLSTNAAVAPLVKADGDFTNTSLYNVGELGQQIETIARDAKAIGVPDEGIDTWPNGFATYFDQAVQGLWVGQSPSGVAAALDENWNSDKSNGS